MEQCAECGSSAVSYHNYQGQPFCWPCADGRGPASPRKNRQRLPLGARQPRIRISEHAVRRALYIAAWGPHTCQLLPVPQHTEHIGRTGAGKAPFSSWDPWGPGTFAIPAGTLTETILLRRKH